MAPRITSVIAHVSFRLWIGNLVLRTRTWASQYSFSWEISVEDYLKYSYRINMSSQSKLLLPISPLSSVSSEHHVTIWALVSGIHEAVGAEGDGRATPEAQDTQNGRDELTRANES